MRTERPEETTRRRKPVVGLAGGIGAGKTTVARILSELGAGVIEADALSHQEINDPDIKEILRQWWGSGVIAPDGTVDRGSVARIVFRDPVQRHRLEALLHPRIEIRRSDLMADYERQPKVRMIVLDSPLLYETDQDLMCDAVIFIDARPECRKDRSEKSRSWSGEELLQREKTQFSLDIKRTRADYICDNNSTPAALREQVERVFAQIVSEAGSG